MYNVKVDVKLSPRGQALMGKDTFTCALNIADADIGQNLQNRKKAVQTIFENQVMPEGMYIPESFQVELINFAVKEGEWMTVEVHLNGSSTIYIPMEVCFTDDDPVGALWFTFKPIENYNYDSYNADLRNSAYTNRTLSVVDKISRYKFNTTDLKPINNNAKMDLAAHPMNAASIDGVNESIAHAEAYRYAADRVAELADNLEKFSTRELSDIVERIDDWLDDEYDTFGL